jgi:hypothetical protein
MLIFSPVGKCAARLRTPSNRSRLLLQCPMFLNTEIPFLALELFKVYEAAVAVSLIFSCLSHIFFT